jgi:hypothetical protein
MGPPKARNPIVPHVRASLGNSLFADFSQKALSYVFTPHKIVLS